MTRSVDTPCSICGELGWRSKRPTPTPRVCRKCRQQGFGQRAKMIGPRLGGRTPCVDCGAWCGKNSERCRPCRGKSQRLRPESDHRVRRYHRDQAAPGLTRTQRDHLADKWRAQRRQCSYCPELADTIDHVVPLIRGGTNYEGNLAPCCRPCNSRKAGWFIAEVRHERKPARVIGEIGWEVTAERPRPPAKRRPLIWAGVVPMFSVCAGCGGVAGPRAEFCGVNCANRTRYRRRVGIPDRAPVWTARAARGRGSEGQQSA